MTGPRVDTGDDFHEALCDELLAYLHEHPQAMDSLDGIVEWWLPRHQIRVAVERVSKALDTLARRNLLERIPEGDAMMYRLRQTATDDAAPPPDDDGERSG